MAIKPAPCALLTAFVCLGSSAFAQQTPPLAPSTQQGTLQTSPQNIPSGQAHGSVRISLDEAIQKALQNNHTLKAARTTIQQNEAQEITANLRPNPTLFTDWEYLPVISGPTLLPV